MSEFHLSTKWEEKIQNSPSLMFNEKWKLRVFRNPFPPPLMLDLIKIFLVWRKDYKIKRMLHHHQHASRESRESWVCILPSTSFHLHSIVVENICCSCCSLSPARLPPLWAMMMKIFRLSSHLIEKLSTFIFQSTRILTFFLWFSFVVLNENILPLRKFLWHI